MRTSLSAAALTASLVLTLPALAQEHALPRYEMAPTGDRFFGVHAPSVPGHLDLHAGAVLDYAHNPFVLRETATGDIVSSYVDHQLLLHTGVTFALWNRLALSAALPVALSQGGDDPRYLGVTQSSPDKAAAGDLRTSARFALVGGHDSAFQVGVGAHLWLPTGSSRLLMSDGTVRAMPYLALGGRLGPEGRAIWNVFGGPELRPSRDLLGAELGTMIRGGAGAAYQVGPRRDVQLGGELNGYVVPREPSSRTTGIELLLSAKLRFLDDFEAGLAAGPGLVGGVGAPSFRGLLGLAYTPRLPGRPRRTASWLSGRAAAPAARARGHGAGRRAGRSAREAEDRGPRHVRPRLRGHRRERAGGDRACRQGHGLATRRARGHPRPHGRHRDRRVQSGALGAALARGERRPTSRGRQRVAHGDPGPRPVAAVRHVRQARGSRPESPRGLPRRRLIREARRRELRVRVTRG